MCGHWRSRGVGWWGLVALLGLAACSESGEDAAPVGAGDVDAGVGDVAGDEPDAPEVEEPKGDLIVWDNGWDEGHELYPGLQIFLNDRHLGVGDRASLAKHRVHGPRSTGAAREVWRSV